MQGQQAARIGGGELALEYVLGDQRIQLVRD